MLVREDHRLRGFRDGGGLASPGNWAPEDRQPPQLTFWETETTYKLTMGESKSPGARACTAAAENAAIVLPDGGGDATTVAADPPPPLPAVSTTLLPLPLSSSIL